MMAVLFGIGMLVAYAGAVEQNISVTRQIPVEQRVDVLVVGGGPAGVSAAVTCAEAGRKVLLVEQSGTFGGASTLAGVAELMNFADGEHFLAGGFGRRIYDGLGYPPNAQRVTFNLRTEEIKRLYDKLMAKAGADFRFYTRLTDVVVEQGRVQYAIVSDPAGTHAIAAQMFVDATGAGFLCVRAGAASDYGNAQGVPMASTLCSIWGGVDFDKKKRQDSNFAAKGHADGVLSQYDTCLPGIMQNYPEVNIGFGNVGHLFGTDDRDAKALTDAMVKGRTLLAEYENYYRRYVPGCEKAMLIRTADYLGVRASRRIRCEKTLTFKAFHAKGRFVDEIGRYSYPVDIHPETADKKGMAAFAQAISLRHGPGASYSIPYGALVPKGLVNVFVAGRSIGADNAMQASVRVIPGCYITGQAAGMAAALAVEQGCAAKDVPVPVLRARLRAVGAYLAPDDAPSFVLP